MFAKSRIRLPRLLAFLPSHTSIIGQESIGFEKSTAIAPRTENPTIHHAPALGFVSFVDSASIANATATATQNRNPNSFFVLAFTDGLSHSPARLVWLRLPLVTPEGNNDIHQQLVQIAAP